MLVTSELLVALDSIVFFFIQWNLVATSDCLVTNILQNIFFCVQLKKFGITWEWVHDDRTFICGWTNPLRQWSQTQFLEGHSSAEFISNKLKITAAWSFLVILKAFISWIRCVWLGLELWPSWNCVWDQCLKGLFKVWPIRLFSY